MPRIDKISFSFRAPAGTAITGLIGVKLNAGGSVIPSGTAAGDLRGACCYPGTIAAGRIVTVLKKAEVVEMAGSVATDYYAGASGSVGTASAGANKIGFTVEGDRLIVDC